MDIFHEMIQKVGTNGKTLYLWLQEEKKILIPSKSRSSMTDKKIDWLKNILFVKNPQYSKNFRKTQK